MNQPFVITQAQWQALELGPVARDIAQDAWSNQGRFALPPNPGSLAQMKLGTGTVVPSDGGASELAIVYQSGRTTGQAGEDPSPPVLYFTVNTAGEFWLKDGSLEWPVDSLDVACKALVEIGKGHGLLV